MRCSKCNKEIPDGAGLMSQIEMFRECGCENVTPLNELKREDIKGVLKDLFEKAQKEPKHPDMMPIGFLLGLDDESFINVVTTHDHSKISYYGGLEDLKQFDERCERLGIKSE